MSKPIIEIQEVSKRYQVGAIGATSLRDEVNRLWGSARARFRAHRPHGNGNSGANNGNSAGKEFWALRDISFDVHPGEIVGIIGRNGAGKSTLLKILSRITQQTSGNITLRGRLSSLLEVGTGFHPELTGRENIFLNGAILGMRKEEIRNRFDEIVAFADITSFLDTPVKRYSTGMYVRLAFGVAAHLEPEILVVDEILAVGDVAFQKKCLRKIDDVATRDGRTVLFVSHNMTAIQGLCSRSIWLEHGRVRSDGQSEHVVRQYLARSGEPFTSSFQQPGDRPGDGTVRLTSITVTAADGTALITSRSGLRIQLAYWSSDVVRRLNASVGVYSDTDVGIYGLESDATGGLPPILPPSGIVTCRTGPINLTPGPCVLNVWLDKGGHMADYVERAARFDVEPDDFHGSGKTPGRDWAVGLVHHEWSLTGQP